MLLAIEKMGFSVKKEIMYVIIAHHFFRIFLSNLTYELVLVAFKSIEHSSNDIEKNQTDFSHP